MQLCFQTRKAAVRHRVLVVDDYPDSAETSSLLLTILGHECRIAHSGSSALDQAAAFDPHIVILDIGLPDMSGYEVARQLRARSNGRRVHLAAVTGWGMPADQLRAFEAGFDQHVLKPTDSAKLKGILAVASGRVASV